MRSSTKGDSSQRPLKFAPAASPFHELLIKREHSRNPQFATVRSHFFTGARGAERVRPSDGRLPIRIPARRGAGFSSSHSWLARGLSRARSDRLTLATACRKGILNDPPVLHDDEEILLRIGDELEVGEGI